MHSTITASTDARSAKYIHGAAMALDFQTTDLNNLSDLRKAVITNTYSAVFVDARFGIEEAVDVAQMVWSVSPFTLFGIFNFYGTIEEDWRIRFIGGNAYHGKDAVPEIKEALKKLPLQVTQGIKRQICLVEDLDSPRQIISSYLQALGYGTVIDAANGKEAIEILEKAPKDFFCVITDLNMPEMSGTDLIGYIRRSKTLMHLPIMVLTSFGNMETLINCMKIGATGFLVKPPKKNHLRLEMEKAIRIMVNHQSPRLCSPEEAPLLEGLLAHLVTP
ncbi:MAG: response regulator [Deltaproteobacteria bacterium]|nr:response regulator [Deltaproteobacteria bacterium]